MGLHTKAFTAACPSRASVSGHYSVIPPVKLSIHKQM